LLKRDDTGCKAVFFRFSADEGEQRIVPDMRAVEVSDRERRTARKHVGKRSFSCDNAFDLFPRKTYHDGILYHISKKMSRKKDTDR